jgi:hypothetical protein
MELEDKISHIIYGSFSPVSMVHSYIVAGPGALPLHFKGVFFCIIGCVGNELSQTDSELDKETARHARLVNNNGCMLMCICACSDLL